MASAYPTGVPSSCAAPMASPGYGKRTAPTQQRRSKREFAHLPEREAFLATLIDQLPEGAAMDTKTLAKSQPRYGQQAVRTALTRLSDAGHLRRVRENLGDGRTQWVHRTYFSRTARDDAWWRGFLKPGSPDEPSPVREDPPSEDVHPDAPSALPEPGRAQTGSGQATALLTRPATKARARTRTCSSGGFEALATLWLTDERMMLSERDCTELAELADEWLQRGATVQQLHIALTVGLPPEGVHSPGAFARRRLLDKLPPAPRQFLGLDVEYAPERSAADEPPRRIMECTNCRAPARPELLPGGLCRPCRRDLPPRPAGEPSEAPRPDVPARAAQIRAVIRDGRDLIRYANSDRKRR